MGDGVSTEASLVELRAALLAWYRAHRRDLPWRRTRDPYAIWVSEVMLQQTRVDTVIPYYERFLSRWPTVRALADADPDEVRAAWSGLGYYRRAETMLKAARQISSDGGELPDDVVALGALPGFGPYTRGAVASIAFDRPVPAVDGNVSRVLARVGAIEGDVTKGAPSRAVWALAAELAPGEAPGELNQALIELGALVCKRNPHCRSCPILDHCRARAERRTDEIPPPRKRAVQKEERWTALLLHDDEQVLLQRRPAGARFGELWTPPLFEGALSAEQARTEARSFGLELGELVDAGNTTHLLTHRKMHLDVLRGRLPPLSDPDSSLRVARTHALEKLGVPTIAVRILETGLPQPLLPATLPGRKAQRSSQASLPFSEEV